MMERKMKEVPSDLIGQDADGVVIQRTTLDNSVVLERYGGDLALKRSARFTPGMNGDELETWYVTDYAGGYFVLARNKPGKQDSAWFYISRISPSTLEPEGPWSLLTSLDTKGRKFKVSMERRGQQSFFTFDTRDRGTEVQCSSTQSPGEKSILFYTDYEMGKGERDGYDMLVLDEALKPRWNAKLSLPYLEQQFDLWETKVDDAGNAYLQGRLSFKGDDIDVKGKPNYEHRLMRVGSEGIEWDAAITLGDKFIKSCFVNAVEQDLYVAGFYAEDKSLEARGLYVQRLDPVSGTIAERREYPFNASFFAALYGADKGASAFAKYEKNKAQGVEQLKLRSFQRLPGGRLRVVGEVGWTEWVSRESSMPGRPVGHNMEIKDMKTFPVYHNEEMLVWTLAGSGEVERVDVVKKVQEVAVWEMLAGYSRFARNEGGDQYFLFNDDPANLDPERAAGERKTAKWNGGKGCVTIVHLGPGGEQERTTLFDIKDDEAALYVGLTVKRSEQETWFFSKFKEQERWVRITY